MQINQYSDYEYYGCHPSLVLITVEIYSTIESNNRTYNFSLLKMKVHIRSPRSQVHLQSQVSHKEGKSSTEL